MTQNRFKSPVLWGAIIILIGAILKNYGLFTHLGLTPESYKELTDLIMAVAVAAGIINNPTNKSGI